MTTDGKVDPKTKTVFVTFAGNKEKAISVATLKRWWTPVDEEETAKEEQTTPEAEPVKEEPVKEEPAPEEAPKPEEPKPEEKKPKKRAPRKRNAIEVSEETAEFLKSLYGTLNDVYFDGLLLTGNIKFCNTRRKYDCCSSVTKINQDEYDVQMSASVLERTVEEIASTVLHAMVHIYCSELDLEETCQNGRYHNSIFRDDCMRRDLAVSYDRANGYVHTSATDALRAVLSEKGFDPAGRLNDTNESA